MIPAGREFYKMSGSGNDFVVVDARHEPPGSLADPEVIRRICARGTGVGADGIVFLESSDVAAVRLTYLNADGSPADLCGNATLCTARLSMELGMGTPAGFEIETDSGLVAARLNEAAGSQPEIDLQPVTGVQSDVHGIQPEEGEQRIGFALVGVPHMVILCDDVSTADVVGRGRPLRHHPVMTRGANVNFVSQMPDGGWRMRTYERGVEAETLACGSGSVATAILLTAWGKADGSVELSMSSGRILTVRLKRDNGVWKSSLSGEGRVVFHARLAEI